MLICTAFEPPRSYYYACVVPSLVFLCSPFAFLWNGASLPPPARPVSAASFESVHRFCSEAKANQYHRTTLHLSTCHYYIYIVFAAAGVHLLLAPGASHSGYEDHFQADGYHYFHHRCVRATHSTY